MTQLKHPTIRDVFVDVPKAAVKDWIEQGWQPAKAGKATKNPSRDDVR